MFFDEYFRDIPFRVSFLFHSVFYNFAFLFRGGAELLFGNVKKHNVTLTEDNLSKCKLDSDLNSWKNWKLGELGTRWCVFIPGTIRKLLPWLKNNLLKERPELFLQDETVRPGILVLVNDADWELMVSMQIVKLTV